jgi:hypothetical protein
MSCGIDAKEWKESLKKKSKDDDEILTGDKGRPMVSPQAENES